MRPALLKVEPGLRTGLLGVRRKTGPEARFHLVPTKSLPLPRAFTLVEVLVSLAIFAISAVVLASAYLNVIGGYTSLGQRQQQETDWQFARVMILSQPDRPKVEAGGRMNLPDGRSFSWQAKIEPTEVPDLFRITLQGDAPAAAGVREPWHREQTLVLLRPTWSEAGDRQKLQAALQDQLVKGRPQ